MGVVYKLIPEISFFIVEQKKSQPTLTCQTLSGMVLEKFGQQVSKSSVHELLKQSHVIIPRARKTKEKFQIPLHKKEQISKSLAPFVAIRTVPALVTSEPEKPPQKPAQKEHVSVKGAGDIFLKSALYDLSFKSVMGISDSQQIETADNLKLKLEWEYLTSQVFAIKVELEDQNAFYIDARFQGIHQEIPQDPKLAAPIERVACEVADYILNNINPIIIREFVINDSNLIIYDFIAAMQNLPGKRVKKIFLIGHNEKILAEFEHPLMYKRRYIISTDSQHNEFKGFMEESKVEGVWVVPGKTKDVTARIVKKQDRIVVTNLNSTSYEEITKQYDQRHPYQSLQITPPKDYLTAELNGENHWLKKRLKERALMFFPPDFTLKQLQAILDLEGHKQPLKDNKGQIIVEEVHLSPMKGFEFLFQLKRAAENLNSLNIINFQGKKIIICIDADSE